MFFSAFYNFSSDNNTEDLPAKDLWAEARFIFVFKVSVKENEVPTEKNSSRASIFATKASYISN